MNLKVVVPTHIWEFKEIIDTWNFAHCYYDDNSNITCETIFEQGEPPSGRNVRQKYTDKFAGENVYVHFLDIDNLISPDVFIWFDNNFINFIKTPKIFMFSQIWHAQGIKRLNAKPENCLPARCDIAQLFVHGSFLKDMVWSGDYENDGQFIAELYRRYPNDFIFINDVNVWYNSLRPHSTLYNGQIITIA